jgi:LysM repeat protein
MLSEKYAELIEYGDTVGMADIKVWEEGGKLHIKGTIPYKMDKKLFWDKIKTFDNWEEEVAANIIIENTDIFGVYTVQSGDSLSKIAKWHLGDPKKYMEIFNLNTDVLKDPNKISVGQKLKLPNVDQANWERQYRG